jgi:uncharacterized RDD family membrane protein YckC
MDKFDTFWRRFGAAFLDNSLLFLLNVAISSTIFPTFPEFSTFVFLGTIISLVYYVSFHSIYGQTLGKILTKVKVIEVSEKPINFGQAILRNLPQLILVMFMISFSEISASKLNQDYRFIYFFTIFFFIPDFAVFLANEKRRALHDFIAGTIVVRTDV